MEKSLQPPGLSCGEGPWHERTTKTAVKSATGKAPKRRPTTGFVLFVPPLYLRLLVFIYLFYSFHDRIFRPIVNSSGAYLFSLFATSVSQLVTGPWSPFDYCHILEVFAVPVVTQPVLSAFVMAAALGLLRVRRAGGLRSDEPLEKTAHRLLCE